MDQLRRIKHNALTAQLNWVNRYLFRKEELFGKVPVGGIYSLDPVTLERGDRNVIAEWAGYLCDALFRRGIRKTTIE